ncbi:MAG: carboxymuconolactone decarboxylase family protein [Bradyrhizobium sp.]|nr:carboxymuconolactone decarboxylase family protein [Bradyrhizobium sp.]
MSRIVPLRPPYAPEIQQQFDRVMRGAPPLMLFRVMAGHARAWDKFRTSSLLDRGPLSLRQREIVIDRTCALNACEYEWGVHVAIFAGAAGLTEAQVRATVLEGADAPCWSEAEQALIAAVDALHHRATLSAAEFAALSKHYDEEQILEVMLLGGFYRTVSYLANGLALPLEATAARFPARPLPPAADRANE